MQTSCSAGVATPLRRGQGDGPADCKRGAQDVASACAAAAPAVMFTRSGTEVEVESGGRPWEIWLDQRLSHGEGSQRGGNVPRAAAATSEYVTLPAPSPGDRTRPGTAGLESSSLAWLP